MKNFLNKYGMYIFIAIISCVFFWAHFTMPDAEKDFYKYLEEDKTNCIDRANRDNKDHIFCSETADSAKLAFRMSVEKSEDDLQFWIFIAVMILFLFQIKSNKRIEILEDK